MKRTIYKHIETHICRQHSIQTHARCVAVLKTEDGLSVVKQHTKRREREKQQLHKCTLTFLSKSVLSRFPFYSVRSSYSHASLSFAFGYGHF